MSWSLSEQAVQTRSSAAFERARAVMPGGVNSPVRAFKGVGGTPRVVERGAGCRVFDVDGRGYIDMIGSWGAMIVGHAHPSVVEAVSRAAQDGFSFGLSTVLEIELGEEIMRRVPSMERVRMVNSGTEAVMSAVRLARAATGRAKIIKFAGGYHGHSDALLVTAGSGVLTLGLPGSPGVTQGATQDTLVVPYNDAFAVREVMRVHGAEVAAIVVEPIAGNMGLVPPVVGFLQTLRQEASRWGALLIFDEVMTGCRVARGGAQELYAVRPDITTLGKVIGGGLPIGAFGGRAELMDLMAPAGEVYQAGTFSGNPIAMTAGLATLRLLDDAAYARLEAASARLAQGLTRVMRETGVDGVVQRVGSMLSIFFGVGRVESLADADAADHAVFTQLFHGLLERGVHLPPSGYESWFVGLAHTDAVIDAIVAATRETLASLGTEAETGAV